MLDFSPTDYGSACAELLQMQPPWELGPAHPAEAMRASLTALDEDSLFCGRTIRDRDMACCCFSGLWLVHHFLDESHQISQKIDTPSGSYWHGIMHRREPDFPNAKYWFRRVGDHPVFEPLCQQAAALRQTHAGDSWSEHFASQSRWDPFRFVDFCEAVLRGRSTQEQLCREIAQVEWQLLFDYCYRKAIE